MNITKIENFPKNTDNDLIQEKMWTEIINRMEILYSNLANRQEEIEKKNRELLKTKEFVENIIKHMANALIVVDSKGNIKMVNHAAINILGYKDEEILGKPMEFIFEKTDGKNLTMGGSKLEKLLKDGIIKDFEIFFRSKEGERIPMVLSGSVTRNIYGDIDAITCVAKDLRDTKRMLAEMARAEAEKAKTDEIKKAYNELQELKDQLIQSEKMASLGQLAAGVAHEINNPLAGVLTYLKLMSKKFKENSVSKTDLSKMNKYVNIMETETARCSEIVKNLLEFARPTELIKELTDLSEIIKKSLYLVKHQIQLQNIEIIQEYQPSVPKIKADYKQIQQVFLNLFINSAQAMPEGGKLTIKVQTENNRSIVTYVIDTGCGIPKENISKIFDPFFTTKSDKKGTGLGLSVAYSIIQRHNGSIKVKSKVGEGTTFIIEFPIKSE